MGICHGLEAKESLDIRMISLDALASSLRFS